MKIELGDTVKCKYTGFKGVAVARTEYINGCIQIQVAPKVGKDNKYPEELAIDEGSLEVTSKLKRKVDEDDGGPTRMGKLVRGF